MIEVFYSPKDLFRLQVDWDELHSKASPGATPTFDEFYRGVHDNSEKVRPQVVVARDNCRIVTIAPLVLTAYRKKYSLGRKRRPLSLPVKILWLNGQTFLSDVRPETAHKIFDRLRFEQGFHLVRLAKIQTHSEFYRSVLSLGGSQWKIAVSPETRNWVIDLPATFDEYLGSLKNAKFRYNTRRSVRRFFEKFGYGIECITESQQIEKFLREGEQLSRQTYQWDVGERLEANKFTYQTLLRQAEQDQLRCYSLSANGKVCAYIRGIVRGGVFKFLATAYDQEFSSWSPGTVLLISAIRDLIENTQCEIFDFGGGDWPYKSRFATRFYECKDIEMSIRRSIYGMFLLALDDALTSAKGVLKALR